MDDEGHTGLDDLSDYNQLSDSTFAIYSVDDGGAAPLRCNHCGEVESVPHLVDCDDCRRLYCATPACLGTHGCVSLVPRRASYRRVPLDDTILADNSFYFCDGTGQTAVDAAVAPGPYAF